MPLDLEGKWRSETPIQIQRLAGEISFKAAPQRGYPFQAHRQHMPRVLYRFFNNMQFARELVEQGKIRMNTLEACKNVTY